MPKTKIVFVILTVIIITSLFYSCSNSDFDTIETNYKRLKRSKYEKFYAYGIERRDESINVKSFALFRHFLNDSVHVFFTAIDSLGDIKIFYNNKEKLMYHLCIESDSLLDDSLYKIANEFFNLKVLGIYAYPWCDGCTSFKLEGTTHTLYYDPHNNCNDSKIFEFDKNWYYTD